MDFAIHRARGPRIACALLAILVCAASAAPAAAQPNPGIDPCSRVLASMATPVDASNPTSSANIRLAVSQTVMNFASCFNRRNWEGILTLAAPGFRESMFGVKDDDEFRSRLLTLEQRSLLPSLQILSIEENGTTGSQLATLVVTWRGWHDVHRELWRVQQDDGFWRLTGRSIQTPDLSGQAVGLSYRVDADGLTAPVDKLVNPALVLLAFQNAMEEDATALVIGVDSNRTMASIQTECNSSGNERFEPVGLIQVPAGESTTMPLQELSPGRYAVIVSDDPCGGTEPVSLDQIETLDISAPTTA